MPGPITIEELCRLNHNEDPHTAHVTALALRIFDRVAEALNWPASHRPLLEAAARLHDVGYRKNPAQHARVGAEMVAGSALASFTDAQRKVIAGAILLHSRDYRSALLHPLFLDQRYPKKVMRLGALLRVADGLDHSHFQNAEITAVRIAPQTVRLHVRSDAYADNVTWAREKSDLWHELFRHALEFKLKKPEEKRPLFQGIVAAHDEVLDGARKILYSQYRVVADNRENALRAEEPEPLHDIRVAVRRFRAALRFFRKPLAATEAPVLNERWRDLNRKLGPIRDADVWIQFLGSSRVQRAVNWDSAWEQYFRHQKQEQAKRHHELREILNSGEWESTMRDVAYFLRVSMCALMQQEAEASPLSPFAAPRLRKTFRRILNHAHLREGASPEEMHQLRRLCRRERYWAEFCTPVVGPAAGTLAKRLKAVADALGDLHDSDVALERIAREAVALPGELVTYLTKKRERAWARFDEAWERLHRKKFRKRVVESLRQCEGESIWKYT